MTDSLKILEKILESGPKAIHGAGGENKKALNGLILSLLDQVFSLLDLFDEKWLNRADSDYERLAKFSVNFLKTLGFDVIQDNNDKLRYQDLETLAELINIVLFS